MNNMKSPSTHQICANISLWWEFVDPNRLTSEEEFSNMSVADKLQTLRECGWEPDSSMAAAALGRKGGQAKSAAKTQAARQNGAKGGRPRKTQP